MTKPFEEAHHREALSIAEQAEGWLQILKSASPAQEAAFWTWVKQSPLHLREVLLSDAFEEAFGRMDTGKGVQIEKLIDKAHTASNVASLGYSDLRRPAQTPKARGRRWGSIAVSVLVVLVVAGLMVRHFLPTATTTYATSIGEQRTIELEDGSLVSLNTLSKVRTHFSATSRDIYLTDGQALFQVEHDAARPFRVHVAATTIEALGTKFDVRLYADRTSVAVVEGVVSVRPDGVRTPVSDSNPPTVGTTIAVGNGATIDKSGTISTSAIDLKVVMAWHKQLLIFQDDTLEFIASEFNHYNTKLSLRVEASARERRFNGVFNVYNPKSFIGSLARVRDLEFEEREGEIVIRARPTAEGVALTP